MALEMPDGNEPVELDDPWLGGDIDDKLADDSNADRGDDFNPEGEGDEEPANDGTLEQPDTKAEEEPDPKAEEEPEPEPEPDQYSEPEAEPEAKDQRIPKDRFDEVNQRMKEAEARLAEIEAAAAAPAPAPAPEPIPEYDFDAAELKYMELVVDGEFEQAQAVRKEIRTAEQEALTVVAKQEAQEAREGARTDISFQEAVNDLEAAYPVFVDGNEGFKQEYVTEVLDLHQGFIDRGMDPVKSIVKATKYVVAMNDLRTAPAADEGEATPSGKPASKTDAKKKAAAKTTQPPQLPKEDGQRESSIDMSSMSEEEFDALPESKKRELRGDFV